MNQNVAKHFHILKLITNQLSDILLCILVLVEVPGNQNVDVQEPGIPKRDHLI